MSATLGRLVSRTTREVRNSTAAQCNAWGSPVARNLNGCSFRAHARTNSVRGRAADGCQRLDAGRRGGRRGRSAGLARPRRGDPAERQLHQRHQRLAPDGAAGRDARSAGDGDLRRAVPRSRRGPHGADLPAGRRRPVLRGAERHRRPRAHHLLPGLPPRGRGDVHGIGRLPGAGSASVQRLRLGAALQRHLHDAHVRPERPVRGAGVLQRRGHGGRLRGDALDAVLARAGAGRLHHRRARRERFPRRRPAGLHGRRWTGSACRRWFPSRRPGRC
jgi:hypothetical protein